MTRKRKKTHKVAADADGESGGPNFLIQLDTHESMPIDDNPPVNVPTSQFSGEEYGVTWFAAIPRPLEAPPEAPVIDHAQCCYHAAGLCLVMREIASAKPGDPPNAVALGQCEMKEEGTRGGIETRHTRLAPSHVPGRVRDHPECRGGRVPCACVLCLRCAPLATEALGFRCES